MRPSISRSRESIWVWLLWGYGIYLLLELGPFVIAAWVLKKSAGELAGPYLAFAVPWAVTAPVVWWLRKWEMRGVSPKRLAHGWGLSMAFFGVAEVAATFYSGVELRLMDPRDAVISFVVMVLLSAPIFYFVTYHRALRRVSARSASGKLGDPRT